jgi:hypothetical protein
MSGCFEATKPRSFVAERQKHKQKPTRIHTDVTDLKDEKGKSLAFSFPIIRVNPSNPCLSARVFALSWELRQIKGR